jgi:CheY-like chemotaxis protein
MFEPFFTTKEVGRGTGMGLAMVHAIVHDHDGHLQVESAPWAGSVVRVLLPAASEHAARDEAAGGTAPAPDPAWSTAPLHGRVLLVEDEPMVGEYMVDLMTGWGLDVVLERDPAAAASLIESGAMHFDVMVTDQTMPRMTGLELARHALRHRPGLATVVCTGNPACIAPGQLVDEGVAALLRKPIDPTALRALLHDLIG